MRGSAFPPLTDVDWDERARTVSTSWGVALWSERGQTLRFVAALRYLDLRPGDSLLDFGCGTGRFSEFLPPYVDYVGTDASPEMLARARREHQRARFIDLAMIDDGDYGHVVALGVWNVSREDPWDELVGLWSRASRTLTASLHRDRFSPVRVAAFVQTLSPAPAFLIDGSYLDNDLLLVLRR